MLTLTVLLLAGAFVIAAGEAVRVQCKRMLSRPVPLVSANDVPHDLGAVAA